MAKTHLHIDSPSADQLAELVASRTRPLADTYLALHDLVISTLPEVRCSVDCVDASVGYGAHQYGYNGWGMAALTPFTRWVSLTLLQGAKLPDPSGLLTGTTTMRHAKLSDPDAVRTRADDLRALLRAAARLHTTDA